MINRKKKTKIFAWLLITLAIVVIAAAIVLNSFPSFGGNASGKRLERMQACPHYRDGRFINPVPEKPVDFGTLWTTAYDWCFGDQKRKPTSAIPVIPVQTKSLNTPPPPGLRAIWLGHASVLIEIDEVRLLVDPVFSEFASPFSIGPKRFHPPPIALADLPKIDAVMISHDHYDHLEMTTTRHLAGSGTVFFVPLGVGAHLEAWDISERQIVELGWWESGKMGELNIFCTPAIHYSGRKLIDTNKTFWSSWTIVGPKHRVFYSGDTGFTDHFRKIGEQFGPFDLTLIKIGSYGPASPWLDIHMNPESAIEANLAVRGRRMLPLHWGTFKLGIHDWYEPIERAIATAKQRRVEMLTPRVGEVIVAGQPFRHSAWWKEVQ
ncbi:MAG: MBL fold metallo-hydrolase [Deltaproteobacteria bacterium]|nr:MBL fold metallo-hydrolase [Deltaproteobacteria bacterium]